MIGFVCKKHPTYKARRAPSSNCTVCQYLFDFVEQGMARFVEGSEI
jgi:hypothetical protein